MSLKAKIGQTIGLVFTLISLSVMPACSILFPTISHFETHNSLCQFSFDFSPRYHRTGGNIDKNYPTMFFVYFDLKNREAPMSVPGAGNQKVSYVPGHMEVDVFDGSFRNATPAGEIERHLAAAQEQPGYELLERSTRLVDGIQAESAFYKNDTLMIWSGTKYFWAVNFESNGLIWYLSAYSEESLVETVKADFAHLLETFTVVN